MNTTALLNDDQPVDPDDELLVGYLDDELDDATRNKVEKRLFDEEAFRSRLQSLQTGWEWLDEMPAELPDEKLVESTIEIVIGDLTSALPSQNPKKLPRQLAWVAGLAVTALILTGIGIVAGRSGWRNELDDLATAQHLDLYSLEPNYQLYLELAQYPRWVDMASTLQSIKGAPLVPSVDLDTVPVYERSEAINKLSQTEKDHLLANLDRFELLDQQDRDKIRQNAINLKKHPQAKTLIPTMEIAEVWMEYLDSDTRDKLFSSDPDVRQTAIEHSIDETLSRLAMNCGEMISDESSDRIYLYLKLLLSDRLKELPPEYMSRRQALIDEGKGDIIKRIDNAAMFWMVAGRLAFGRGRLGSTMRNRMPPPPPPEGSARLEPANAGPAKGPTRVGERIPRGGNGKPSDSPSSRRGGMLIREITEDELYGILTILPDEALQQLEDIASWATPSFQTLATEEVLRRWALESIKRQRLAVSGDKSVIKRYLDQKNSDAMDMQKPDQFLQDLENLFSSSAMP